MAFKIIPKLQNSLVLNIWQIENFRNFGRIALKHFSTKRIKDLCYGKKKQKKRWFWRFRKEKSAEPAKAEEKPTPVPCRRPTEDLDLSALGGTPYRTCGSAYVIQKDQIPVVPIPPKDAEQKLVERLEKHPDLKNLEDPMPPFESVEQRMLDLDKRKLHPLYKIYMSFPKKPSKMEMSKFSYKSRSGPVCSDEIPSRLKCKEFLEKKNFFTDFKRVDPPRQLLAKMLEIQLNEKPTMERKTSASTTNATKEVKVENFVKV
ncbi:hypothetical protein JTB14_029390 [Gonioctena quinquepunctata]|nr:hypothetical protein JTB14_029390 [Gonioctena quinquepunctata]